ncbi:ABC transporter permease [Halosimplex pelagicum]|uniref:ABC transporter permease n=2 Tax=Halosimplex pelagicum TaxID=869886 RepID=A0A7D5TWM4_9EURY|nr:ABC transporter permease [Halosimplex pelagicum]
MTNRDQTGETRITDGGTDDFPLSSFEQKQSVEVEGLGSRVRDSLLEMYAVFKVAWSDWRTKASLFVLSLYAIMGTVGVMVVPEPTVYPDPWIQPFQTWEFPLGTNRQGQDIFAAIVHASPNMYKMILAGGIFATGVGATVGIVSGYKRGRVDELLMTFTDVAMTIPGLPLIIVISAIFEPSNPIVVGVLISINSWAGHARGIRSQVLTIRENSYVEASRFMGVKTPTILAKDITPQMMPLILIGFVDTSRQVIFSSVALYFLGILPFEGVNWGVLMNLAYRSGAAQTPSQLHALLFPVLTVVLLSWAMIMLVQGLDRVVNPRIRAKHKAQEKEEIQ